MIFPSFSIYLYHVQDVVIENTLQKEFQLHTRVMGVYLIKKKNSFEVMKEWIFSSVFFIVLYSHVTTINGMMFGN